MVVFGSGSSHLLLGSDVVVNTSTSASGNFTDVSTTNLTAVNSSLGAAVANSIASSSINTNTLVVNGNTTIAGNLTITGTTTSVNSTDLNIIDKIITLGKTSVASIPSNSVLGLEFDRGTTKTKYYLMYNEGDETIRAGLLNDSYALLLRDNIPQPGGFFTWDGGTFRAVSKTVSESRNMLDVFSKGETNGYLLNKSDAGHTHASVNLSGDQTIGGSKTFTSIVRTDQIEPITNNLHLSSLVVYPNDKASLGTNQEPYQQFEIHGTSAQVGMQFHNGSSNDKYAMGMYDSDFVVSSGENLNVNRILKLNGTESVIYKVVKMPNLVVRTDANANRFVTHDASSGELKISQHAFYTSSEITGLLDGKAGTGHVHNSDAVTEGSTNLYFTNARSRLAFSGGNGITYNNSTGVIAVNTGVVTYAGFNNVHMNTANSILRVPHVSVEKSIAFNNLSISSGSYFDSTGGVVSPYWDHRILKVSSEILKIQGYSDGEKDALTIHRDGRVAIGIGSVNGLEALYVNGTMKATQIKTDEVMGNTNLSIRTSGNYSLLLQPNNITVLAMPHNQFPTMYKPMLFSFGGNAGSFANIYKTAEYTSGDSKEIILDNATYRTHVINFNGYLTRLDGTDDRHDLMVQFYWFNTGTNAWVIEPLEANVFRIGRGATYFGDVDSSNTLVVVKFTDANYDISLKIKVCPKMTNRQQVQVKSSYTQGNVGSTLDIGSCHPTSQNVIGKIRLLAISTPNFFASNIVGRMTVTGKDVISLADS